MNNKRCPSEEELLAFVDSELSPQQLQRVGEHVLHCSVCEPQVTTLRALIADIQAPLRNVDALAMDTRAHVAAVMARLDEPAARASNPRQIWAWLTTITAAAAALLLWVRLAPPSVTNQGNSAGYSDSAGYSAELAVGDARSAGQFTARGSASAASLARDVGVQMYTFKQPLEPLQAGAKLRRSTALTAGLRNLGEASAYLLLFAVDANGVVHWVAPEFTDSSSDPAAYVVQPSLKEQPLPSSVQFEDLAIGRLRVVALIAPEPLRVSDIEKLTPRELDGDLAARFPRAAVREVEVEVVP